MYKSFIFSCSLIIMSCYSCRNISDKDYFIGDISEVEISNYDEINKFDSILIEDELFGRIAVYDTLLFCWNQKVVLGDYYYSIYSLNSGQKIGEFFSKGEGPNETLGVPPIFHIYNDQGNMKSLIFAVNNDQIFLWNISASLDRNTLVCDTVYDYNWRIDHKSAYLDIVFLNIDTMIARIPSFPLSSDGATTSIPCLEVRTLSSNQLVHKYDLFKKTVYNENSSILQESFFGINASVRPQKDKLALGMIRLGQLNIVDVKTGQIKSTRIKNSGDISMFAGNMTDAKHYYHSVTADEDYIYALCADEYLRNIDASSSFNKLHIFDWNGALIKAIKLPVGARQLRADITNGYLYTYDDLDRVIYKYALSDIVN